MCRPTSASFAGDNDGTGGWHVTAGMPRYEVMHLEMHRPSRVPTCAIAGLPARPLRSDALAGHLVDEDRQLSLADRNEAACRAAFVLCSGARGPSSLGPAFDTLIATVPIAVILFDFNRMPSCSAISA